MPAPEVVLVAVSPGSMETPPLGLACLQAYLEQQGIACELVDANAALYRAARAAGQGHLWRMQESARWLLPDSRRQIFRLLATELDDLAAQLASRRPALLAFSVFGTMQYTAIELITRVRSLVGAEVAVVIGGPACFTAADRAVFYDSCPAAIDALVSGEGERTLMELVERRRRGAGLEGTPGAVVPRPAAERESPLTPRPFLPRLDALPFPSFAGFDLSHYTSPALPIQWSRGCVRRCAFCENRTLWGAFRPKSPARIYEELRHHRDVYGLRTFSLCDTAFNTLPGLDELCRRLADRPLDVSWSGSFLALPNLEPDLFARLRQAGCTRVEIGVESGSDQVLRLMHKGTTVAATERALRLGHDAGLFTCIFLLVGFPGEREEDFLLTLDFLRRNADAIDLVRSINVTVLQHGTELMEQRDRFGVSLPEPSHLWGLEWRGPHDNTPETRKERLRRALTLLDELGLPHELKSGIDELT
jgi:anaerobic magnesium-protoporphyrin IX monomethyl ester cyclase